MTVLEKIEKKLEEAGIEYSKLIHKPVHTSQDAARVRDTDISMGAKALVFWANKTPRLFVVPADKRVNTKKIKSALGIKDLYMASPSEVLELTGLKVGSIPPVGSVIGLVSIFSDEISKKDEVVFNAGKLTVSIKMHAADLIELENPQIADIT